MKTWTEAEEKILRSGRIPRDRFAPWLEGALKHDGWHTDIGNKGQGRGDDYVLGTPLSFFDERIGVSKGVTASILRGKGDMNWLSLSFDMCDKMVLTLGCDWNESELQPLYESVNLAALENDEGVA